MAKILNFAKDALTSLVGNLGIIGKDKAASVTYTLPLWTELDYDAMYRGAWLPKKIVNIPALDTFRKWRNWQADDAQIEAIEAEEQRLGLQVKLVDAMIKARLYGGAAIYISTGETNTALELTPERVKKGGIRFLNVMPKRLLSPGALIEDPESEWFGQPEYYTLASNAASDVKIHPSRLIIFKGEKVPDETLAAGNMGWGDSVLMSTLEAIKSMDSTAANIVSLIFEAKIDIVKIPDLMNNLADPMTEQLLLNRFALANVAKGNNGILLLDGEEEYESKSMNFSALPEVLQSMMVLAAGAADIPATRLMGQSPAGMNATGESDLRNYYDRIASGQTLIVDPAMRRFTECLIRSALGSRDPNIHYVWASLWQTTDKERADIGKVTADTIVALNNTGLYPQEALAKAGINMLIESSVIPGFDTIIEEEGGLPDYEADLEAERQNTIKTAAAVAAAKGGNNLTQDARPMTLYVRRDVINVDDIRSWAKSQGFTSIEDDLHVTIICSRTPVDWIAVGQDAEWADGKGKMTVNEGGPRLMERFGKAIVLQFASQRLAWRNYDIRSRGAEVDFPEYQPHITITWNAPEDFDLSTIEPYRGVIELGPEIFEEVNDDWQAGLVEEEI